MPRPTRLIGRALLAALVAVTVGAIGSPPGSAVTTDASIDVVIDEITPLVPRPSSTLAVTGRVVNISPSPVRDVSVRLRTSVEPLDDRALIAEIAGASLNPNAPYDNRYFDVTRTPIAAELAPGEQAPFAIRVPMRTLRLRDDGAYTLSVEALGTTPGLDEFEERKGIQRTFMPWFPDPATVTPIGLTWLWPLAEAPARAADGSLLDDRTPIALSPGGRLRTLVDIGAESAPLITWVADPELLQAAVAISRGYQVIRNGELVVGDRSSDAAAWLARLRQGLRGSRLHVLPYADVDAGAVRRAGLSDDVVRSITQAVPVAEAAIGERVRGGLAWSPSGRFDKQTANLLATSGVRTVVLSSDAMGALGAGGGSGVADYGTAAGIIDAVLVDQGLQDTLGLPQTTAADVLAARQRFLAQTAMIASAGDGRLVVAGPADIRWDPDRRLVAPLLRATTTAPWLRPASLAELVDAPRVERKRAAYGEAARRAELPADYLDRVVRTQGRLDRLASVLVDPAMIVPPFTAAILRTESSAWRTEPRTGEQLVTVVDAEIAERTGAVRALSSGTVTFSGDSGRVPVTIANDGTSAVLVGVRLVGSPASRLESTPHEPIEVAPGHRASLDLDARVVGGEPLTVAVQLLTPEGKPFGAPEQITLASTAYARAAAWVVGLAFAAIAVFVVVGLTRRIMRSTAKSRGSGTVSS